MNWASNLGKGLAGGAGRLGVKAIDDVSKSVKKPSIFANHHSENMIKELPLQNHKIKYRCC